MTRDGAAPCRRATPAPTRRGCAYADGWDVLSISPGRVLRSNACKVLRRCSERPASLPASLPGGPSACACVCVSVSPGEGRRSIAKHFSLLALIETYVFSPPLCYIFLIHAGYGRRTLSSRLGTPNSRLCCLNTRLICPPSPPSPTKPPPSLTEA